MLQNLMENGLRALNSSHVGKSIIFARNHKHAVLLHDLFNELYPQYGDSRGTSKLKTKCSERLTIKFLLTN